MICGLDFFKSSNVSWNQGFIHLQKAMWHSCMQWGWDAINRGDRLLEWEEYWVLSFKWRKYGISWQFWPHRIRR